MDPMVWINHGVHTFAYSRFFLLFLFPFICGVRLLLLARACFFYDKHGLMNVHTLFLSTYSYSLSRGVVLYLFCEWHGVIHVRICNWIVGERVAYPCLCPLARL